MNQGRMQNMGGFPAAGPGNGAAQANADMQNDQMMRFIRHSLQQNPVATGWRSQVNLNDRIVWIRQISIDSLRLLSQPFNDVVKVTSVTVKFEHKALSEANDKEAYIRKLQEKLGEIRDNRAQQAGAQGPQNPAHISFQQMQQMQQMGQNLRFQPQLQHQMQASPIPQSQGQQMGMNGNPALNMQVGGPAMGGRPSQQQHNFVQNQQSRPNPHTIPKKLTLEDNQAINKLANQLAGATSIEDRRKIAQNLQNMPPDQLQNIKAKGVDPMAVYFRDRATKEWRRQQQALAGNPNLNPNMQMTSAFQAQRPMQIPANMAATQGARSMPGNGQPGGAPFSGNMDHFQGLQADGLRSQEEGQLVVPASNGQGINPEQFRLQQFVNNQQAAKPNVSGRVNQQFVAQQPQPTPMQPNQGLQQTRQDSNNNPTGLQVQAQSQTRARVEAAARAQGQINPQSGQMPQAMSQSGTPLTMVTRPAGPNGQGAGPPQPQATPQPRPASRAPNPGPQPLPQAGQDFLIEGQQNHTQRPIPQPQNLAGLPQALQALLRDAPQSQWKEIYAKYRQQAMHQPRFPPSAPPMSQTLSQPGHSVPVSNGQMMGENVATSLPMQHSASAGLPMAQGANSGMGPTPQMMLQQQRRQQEMNRGQPPQMLPQQVSQSLAPQGTSLSDRPEISINYMDQQLLPPQLYDSFVQRKGLPGQIKTWSQLKQYLTQNPEPQLPMDKMVTMQKLQFDQMLRHMNRNRQVGDQNRPAPVQPGAGLGPQPVGPTLSNMQGQMPQGLPQQNPGSVGMMSNMPPVTREEIQRMRMEDPRFAQMPDDKIRAYLVAYKQSEMRKRISLAHQPHPQQQNNQPLTFLPGQTPAQPPQVGQPRQQNLQPGTTMGNSTGQPSQIRPGMPGPRPQPTSAPRPLPQPSKGLKRPIDDEVTDRPNLSLPTSQGNLQPDGPGPTAAPLRVLTKEEVSRLSPEQQKAYRDKQNHHQQQMLLKELARLTEEVRRASPALQPLALDGVSRGRLAKVLTAPKTRQMLARFNNFLYQYSMIYQDFGAIKQLLSYRMHLFPQYTPASIKADTWELADQLSISADYAEAAVNDLQIRYSQVMARLDPQRLSASTPAQSDASGSHPLSADNLKKHQDMQTAQRAKRPAPEVPPAPTAAQPPFTFAESSPRGQGTPRYAPNVVRQGVKQEDLKLPPKRQKKNHQDNAASTPVSVHAMTAASPPTAMMPQPDGFPFKCMVAECEFHEKGFATKTDLDSHAVTTHKPAEEYIADPLAFLLDSMQTGLELDENGVQKVQARPEALKAPEMQKTGSRATGAGSKPPTPAPAAAMAREASQGSGAKDISSRPLGRAEANGGPSSTSADATSWQTSHVSLSDLHNAFGDLVNGPSRSSLTDHDPLAPSDVAGDFMEQFMDSRAWTQVQETPAPVDSNSSKATESPAQHSDRGQGSSDISKGDELFIKIGTQDTELTESWALPVLKLGPEDGVTEGRDEVDLWMRSALGDGSNDEMGSIGDVDMEWKDVDWDKMLAEQEQEQAQAKK